MEHPLVDLVRNADTIKIPDLGYRLKGLGQNRAGNSGYLCVSKAAGMLAFSVTTAELGISEVDIVIVFQGTPDPGGAARIVWHVDQPLSGTVFSIVRLERLHGSIVTDVEELPAALGPGCGPDQRLFRCRLVTSGGNDTLHVDTSLGTADVEQLMIAAPGADVGEVPEPLFFEVGLSLSQWQKDGCGRRYHDLGATVAITAVAQNVQAVTAVSSATYDWTVPPGVTVLSGLGTATLTVRLDVPGNPKVAVDLTLATMLESATKTGTVALPTLTSQQVDSVNRACRILQIAKTAERAALAVVGVGEGITLPDGTRIVDPLWDPPRGEREAALAERLAHQQFDTLHRTAQQLVRATNDLLRSAYRTLETQLADTQRFRGRG